MGVPKYYRWLSERYPLINQAIYDAIRPEFDCMYLDMNGIIHAATHGPGVDITKPLSDDTAMANVFQYIDKVVRLGRPNRLLYMCLDGVAPRAKMNQQRQRRFRSAESSAKARDMAIAQGTLSPDAVLFDSNCITPGTTFMAKLTEHLKFFIRKKVEEDPLWRQFTVLFSGHEVPGEAEHKIMRYIRTMKTTKGYDPNTRHLLYGLDADLIFLSLATHEPHFALLREEIVFGNPKNKEVRKPVSNSDEFQLLHISILRDCLEHEFRSIDIPFGFDLERIIDDWVFISFFIGNDFIPHLPSMDIHHGTLDKLISVYKSLITKFDGYMTDSGTIDMEKLEVLFHRLSEFELEILEIQKRDIEYIESRRNRSKVNSKVERLPVGAAEMDGAVTNGVDESESDEDDLDLAVRNLEIEEEDLKATYYNEKWYGVMEDPVELQKLCRSYLEGLCWVLQYYYQGVQSWGWFYPYFYAPLTSSMRNLSQYEIQFTMGEPFLPFEQLLGVLPPASAPLIPKSLGELMTVQSSPIIDFYPTTFAVDMNGKKNDWEGIALIPFVDETRLIAAIRSLPKSSFTREERIRNRHGDELTFKYDLNIAEPIKSSIPEIFGSLEASHCRVQKFALPPSSSGPFRSHLCDGVKMPAPSFPCLNLLNITMALGHAHVDIFGHASKRESLVASIVSDPSVSLLDYARGLIGKQCIVDWPFLRDALLISVTDGKVKYSMDAPDGRPLNLKEVNLFADEVAVNRLQILSTRAVDIGDEKVRVEVRLFTGMGRNSSGATFKKFSQESSSYPAQLVIASRLVSDKRFDTAPAQSIKEAFPVKSRIIYIGTPPELYGCDGIVLGHDSKFSATVRLSTFTAEKCIKASCQAVQAKEVWVPSFKAAQQLGMSPSLLGRISAAVLVNPGRANLGLNLKLVHRQMMVPGYTRVRTSTSGLWEYSQAAIRLIEAYQSEFPDLFNAVEESNQKMVDLREYVDDPKEYISTVAAWLKSQPCSNLPLVPQTSCVLSPDAIAEIERTQSQLHRSQKKCEDISLANVPLQYLYKQAQRVQWSPTEMAHTNLGDRVMFLGGHHGVPFGMRGNVVGAHESELDVVFDETILSGTDLNGRCSASRGLTLAPKCLLNLSRPRVPQLHPKAPRPEAVAFDPRLKPAAPQPNAKTAYQAPAKRVVLERRSERVASVAQHPPVHRAVPDQRNQSQPTPVKEFVPQRGRQTVPEFVPQGSRQPIPTPVKEFVPQQGRQHTANPTRHFAKTIEVYEDSRDWVQMWMDMQDPETAAKMSSNSKSLTQPAPPPPSRPRQWLHRDDSSSASYNERYMRQHTHHPAVPRAPVINQQRPDPSRPRRYRPKEQPTVPVSDRQGAFSTHSSMKTLFGLNESPTETARRSLLPSRSPTADQQPKSGHPQPSSKSK